MDQAEQEKDSISQSRIMKRDYVEKAEFAFLT